MTSHYVIMPIKLYPDVGNGEYIILSNLGSIGNSIVVLVIV